MAKHRELFEKVFSELRKQREDRERFTRVGARVKSDAEMEEIMDGLQEQEVIISTHFFEFKTSDGFFNQNFFTLKKVVMWRYATDVSAITNAIFSFQYSRRICFA